VILAAKAGLGMLATMAVHGTLLALIAFVILRGRRMRPAWQAAVWLVVLAKFALPWGPAMPWSLADVLASLQGDPVGGPIVVGAPGSVPVEANLPWVGWLVLAILWAAGAAFTLARAALASRRTHVAARAAIPAPEGARKLLGELAARVGVRVPRLVIGESAHVVGVVRPIIVIPLELIDDPMLLRAVLLHELAHVRRRDALGRLVQLVALAVFWFWPVVRIASRRLERAREAACDAWALEAGEISRPAYARLLLRMAQLGTHESALALAAPHVLDDRVAIVLGPPVRPRLGFVHRLALLGWIALALGGARSAHARGERGPYCVYTPELAEALRLAHPEADLDGDGVLSRAEACDFQAVVKRRVVESEPVSKLDDATAELLAEPLCCNCDAAEGTSSAAPLASCQSEGAVP
jgi:beta-lactamase regulating signal transducer with metallopeptidase domain